VRKIPTLFQREFDHHRVVNINPVAPPELQWVLDGEGIATEKVDGACCAIINGTFYKRYDAKKDKRGRMKLPPEGAIPCDVPDPVTGHWPHWVKVEESDPADRWFVDAYKRAAEKAGTLADGTYEAIGPHFQSNPYHLAEDVLVRHGAIEIDLPDRSFEGIRDYLERHAIEGIVFWKDGKPRCKIKRKDFGFKWPCDGVGKDIDKAEVISRTADGDRVNQAMKDFQKVMEGEAEKAGFGSEDEIDAWITASRNRERSPRYKIVRNAVRCNHCGDVIESTYRHNFVTCSCGRVSVDGGFDYLRRCGDPSDYTDLSETEGGE
jgi:hypothetical protein